jgi:hypothetical protein
MYILLSWRVCIHDSVNPEYTLLHIDAVAMQQLLRVLCPCFEEVHACICNTCCVNENNYTLIVWT